jgi:serine/threonine protein kinase
MVPYTLMGRSDPGQAVSGQHQGGQSYKYTVGESLHTGKNSTITTLSERLDLVTKFPTDPEAEAAELRAYALLASVDQLPIALTTFVGSGDGHILLRRLSHSANRQRLRDDQLLRVALALIEALGMLLKLELVHGDITPFNVMLDSTRSTPYLIDFGASIYGSDPTRLPVRDETSYWPVPQVHRHKHHDDIWSALWILLALRDSRIRPDGTGAIPPPSDQIDRPIIAVINQLPALATRAELFGALKQLRASLKVQLRDMGFTETERVFAPSRATTDRITGIMQERQKQLADALRGLRVEGYIDTHIQTPTTTTYPTPLQAPSKPLRRFLDRLWQTNSDEGGRH